VNSSVKRFLTILNRALPLTECRCGACGRIAPHSDLKGGSSLCQDCRNALFDAASAPCPGCGQFPTAPQTVPTLCGECRRKPRPWRRVIVCGPYSGRLKDLVLQYKFNQRLDLGRQLQECALAAYTTAMQRFQDMQGPELIIPVPLHGRRLLGRGFNQAKEIGRLLSSRMGAAIEQRALERVRRTVPQMRLARAERATNIAGAFAAKQELVCGKRILLIDDIMTTGSTLEECTRVLLAAGASEVDVLVLARA